MQSEAATEDTEPRARVDNIRYRLICENEQHFGVSNLQGKQTVEECKAEEFPPIRDLRVRVCGKRTFHSKGVVFLDCISTTAPYRQVELCIRSELSQDSTSDALDAPAPIHSAGALDNAQAVTASSQAPDVPSREFRIFHSGDVLDVVRGKQEGVFVRNPEVVDVSVAEFRVVERWGGWLQAGPLRRQPSGEGRTAPLFQPPVSHRRAGGGRAVRAVLQVGAAKCARLLAYLGAAQGLAAAASQLNQDRLIFVYAGNAVFEALLSQDHSEVPAFLHSILRRVYFLTEDAGPFVSLEETAACLWRVNVDARGHAKVEQFLRVMAFPRELETTLYHLHTAREPPPDTSGAPPTDSAAAGEGDSARCDAVVYADGLFWLGLCTPRIIVPEKVKQLVPCNAYWKLHEIFASHRKLVLRANALRAGAPPDRALVGIDVGASPGGWTYCLSVDFGYERVLAVDPAEEMHPLVQQLITAGKVSHFVGKIEDMTCNDLRGSSGFARAAAYVCDMNVHMEVAVDMLARCQAGGLLDCVNGCLVVLTFKMTDRKTFHERKAEQMRRLEQELGVLEVQEVHLLANTRQETTIVGRLGAGSMRDGDMLPEAAEGGRAP